MLNIPQINHIKTTAKELFVQSYLTPIHLRSSSEMMVTNPELVEAIMSVVGDAGMIYLSVWENVSGLWAKFREQDDAGVCQWLLQAATTFRILAFTNGNEYQNWVEHLVSSYCSHAVASGSVGQSSQKELEEAVAIDDEYADRIPRATEYRALMYANPWFVYLASLQLSYHEIYSEILTSQFTDDLKSQLTGSRGVPQ